MRLAEIAREIGPEEYDEDARAARARRNRGGRPHNSRLGGMTGPSPFGRGPIPRGESRLRAERRQLLEELHMQEEQRNQARARGDDVADDHYRPQYYNPHNRRFDGDGAGPSGGVGV